MTNYQKIMAFLFWIFQGNLGYYVYLISIDEEQL